MNIFKTIGTRIESLAACVPRNAVENDEKAARATGILTRRVALEGTTVVDLCAKAAMRALADAGAKAGDFGGVVFVSFTQHDRMPCAAAQIQARLGLPRDIIAFDVMLACSGWAYGLSLAALLVRETGRRVLLLDGDVQSAYLSSGDVTTSPLLADGGTATVLGPAPDAAPWRFAFSTDGAKGDALRLPHGGTITMDGFGVFRFVATEVTALLGEFLAGAAPFDRFVPHQPNVYMVRQLAKGVGIDAAKVAVSCDRLGNLSSASIPATIAWTQAHGHLLVAGFGGGLSVSLGEIDIPDDAPLAVVED